MTFKFDFDVFEFRVLYALVNISSGSVKTLMHDSERVRLTVHYLFIESKWYSLFQ